MRNKNKSFTGYKRQDRPRQKDMSDIKLPKAYKVNGFYVIGEREASLFAEAGFKVEGLDG